VDEFVNIPASVRLEFGGKHGDRTVIGVDGIDKSSERVGVTCFRFSLPYQGVSGDSICGLVVRDGSHGSQKTLFRDDLPVPRFNAYSADVISCVLGTTDSDSWGEES